MGRRYHLHPHLGRIHLSSDRDGLLLEKIIGYAIAGNMRTGLVAEALHMAVRNQPPIVGETVFHSDRGSQYTSADYAEIMNTYGIRASVGRNRVVLRQCRSGII